MCVRRRWYSVCWCCVLINTNQRETGHFQICRPQTKALTPAWPLQSDKTTTRRVNIRSLGSRGPWWYGDTPDQRGGGGPVTLLAACVGAPSGALLRNKERRSAPAGALCARVELAKPLTGWWPSLRGDPCSHSRRAGGDTQRVERPPIHHPSGPWKSYSGVR